MTIATSRHTLRVVIGLTALCLFGCDKPAANSGKPSGAGESGNVVADSSADESPASQSPANELPAGERVQLTAKELDSAFQPGGEDEYKRLAGKVVEIRGECELMGPYSPTTGFMMLGTCKLVTADAEPWAKVLPGQQVVLAGKVDDEMKLHIVEAIGERLVVQATDLAQSFKPVPAGEEDSANDRWMEISGKVVKTENADAGCVNVFLEGAAGVHVRCNFPGIHNAAAFAEKLKPGDEVRLIGKQLAFESTDGPAIMYCLGISK